MVGLREGLDGAVRRGSVEEDGDHDDEERGLRE